MLWLLDTVYHIIYLLPESSLQRERQERLESESRTLQIKGKWKMVRSKKRLWKSHIIRTLNFPQVQVTQVEKQLNFCHLKRQPFDQRRGRLGKEVSLLGRQGICARYRSEPKKCVCILVWSKVCSHSSPGLRLLWLHLICFATTARQLLSRAGVWGSLPLHTSQTLAVWNSLAKPKLCIWSFICRDGSSSTKGRERVPNFSPPVCCMGSRVPDSHHFCFVFVHKQLSELCLCLVLLLLLIDGESNPVCNNGPDCLIELCVGFARTQVSSQEFYMCSNISSFSTEGIKETLPKLFNNFSLCCLSLVFFSLDTTELILLTQLYSLIYRIEKDEAPASVLFTSLKLPQLTPLSSFSLSTSLSWNLLQSNLSSMSNTAPHLLIHSLN